MGLMLVAPAAANPVTLTEAKVWCRVDGTADDAALQMLLDGAVGQVEQYLGRSIGVQTWQLVLDAFSDAIELPRGPVSAVSAFTYVDLDGNEQAIAPSSWTLDLVSDPQWIVLNQDSAWPDVLDAVNVIKVTFVAGYAVLPAPIRLAVLGLVAQGFDNRTPGEMSAGMRQQLSPFRRIVI